MKARIYNPHKRKLDSRTVGDCPIGCLKKSKCYEFYYPNHSSKIIQIGNVRLIKDGEVSWSVEQ